MTGGADDLVSRKAAQRARAKQERALAHAAAEGAAERAAAHFLGAIDVEAGAVVSGYRPIQTEIDPTPLMIALIGRGARVCVPVIELADAPLDFRVWAPETAMTEGAFGAPIPKNGASAIPSVMIVPLLAFDRAGARLGYGGGHFDRSIAALRAEGPLKTIGLAYAAQESEALPQEPTDQRLDAVVTEQGAIFFSL